MLFLSVHGLSDRTPRVMAERVGFGPTPGIESTQVTDFAFHISHTKHRNHQGRGHGGDTDRKPANRRATPLTEPGGSASSGAHLNSFPLFQSFDVTHRRLAEEAAVFTIELADTFVSNLKGHS
jgi:hypothetical protein